MESDIWGWILSRVHQVHHQFLKTAARMTDFVMDLWYHVYTWDKRNIFFFYYHQDLMNIIAREFTWCIGSCEVHIFAVSRFIVRILPSNENLKNKWRTNSYFYSVSYISLYISLYISSVVENSNFTFVSLKLWRKIFHPSWCYCRKQVEFRKAGTVPPHLFYRAQAEFRKVGWGSSPHRRRRRCSPAFFFYNLSASCLSPCNPWDVVSQHCLSWLRTRS